MTASKAATEAQPASTSKTTTLSLKRVGIDTYRENVAYLHRDCAIYRVEGFQALAKIEVQARGKRILASLNVVDDAMSNVGRRLDWQEHPVVDKHCIGGIPGSRTSMLVVPIVAAHGLLYPTTSSRAIMAAQGMKDFDPDKPPLSPLSFDVAAPHSGMVVEIDNVQLARIARSAGPPRAKGSGVDLLVKLGEQVEQGQALYRVYAAYPTELAFARQACQRSLGYRIGAPELLLPLQLEY